MYKIIAVSSSTTELDIAAKRLQRVARRFLSHQKKIDDLLFALCNTPSTYITHKQITAQKVEEILNEKKNINVKSPEGKTLIHLAAESQRLDLIMLLLRAEPQLAIDDLEKDLELLADKVDFSMPDNNGKTPLHHLVEMENLKAIDFLIGKGVDFNVPDQDKKTPAHYAANSGNLEIIDCLWENGVDFREPDTEGNTPLQIVFGNSFESSISLFNKQMEIYGNGIH